MTMREKLIREVETVCKVIKSKFDKINSELLECIGEDEVVDYCIMVGPTPDYPDLVLDIMILTNDYICDFDLREDGSRLHIQPLRSILRISEEYVQGEEDYINTIFKIGGTSGGLETQVKRDELGNVRRFIRSVRSQMFKK